ncbi:MAG: SAM-dependent methyltransferase [Halobacteriovoraceae bacterium]|nr:SAM-dependent methyltransferase [Halobacteriovoraceae bacterium]|tara:strand:+ start:7330 stop:7935 length:606 start_codon:yes stop_codon:yes gene_type:complete
MNKTYTEKTIHHYNQKSESFWEGTRDHDVSQNIKAMLDAIQASPPFTILDFGCGPGRDLKTISDLGHKAIGLDGSENFVQMAKDYSQCEVLHQNFIELDLPSEKFDAVFANASLFHVPKEELKSVLHKLNLALKPGGVLFSSNPRGTGEVFDFERYAHYMQLDTYQALVEAQGFQLIHHYFRPDGLPIEQRPWLACVFRKK